VLRAGEDDVAERRGEGGRQLLDERHEHRIDEDVAVLRVLDHVADLLGEEPRVDRVQHVAGAGDGVVQLEVPEVVPRERRDAIGGREPEPAQGVRELRRAAEGVAVAVAMARMIGRDGHDLAIRVLPERVPHERADEQRHVHHQGFMRTPEGAGVKPLF
jgi:hypothetical protein